MFCSPANSPSKSDSAFDKREVVSRYLRASIGSCHDFCKFGKIHSAEEKGRKPFRKRISKSLRDEPFVQIIVPCEKKKEKIVKHKPETDTKKSNSSDLNPTQSTISYSLKPNTSSSGKKVLKNEPLLDTKILLSHDKKQPSFTKTKNSSGAKTGSSPNENGSSKSKPIFKKTKSLFTKKGPSLDPPEFVKSVCFPSANDDEPVKSFSLAGNKTLSTEKKSNRLSKPSSSPVKLKPVKVKPALSSTENLDLVREKGIKHTRTMISFKRESGKKALVPSAATFSPKFPVIKRPYDNSRKAGNAKSVSRSRDINKVMRRVDNNEKDSEKILHVIDTKNVNTANESTPNDEPVLSLSPPPNFSFLSCPEEEHEEKREFANGEEANEFISEENESLEIVKKNHSKTLKKSKSSVSEDYNKTRSPVKLKFRNGKFLDAQLNNSANVPSKLRFRNARVVRDDDEGKSSDLRRKLFKKSDFISDWNKSREEVSSEKVVLKHQDVQGKKGHQGLFNNVIEQTASKLVESRKSKVKALVGAFETVISLQESKPSPQAVN
ncbi:Plant calmodulin-binding protein-related [Striga hermonthica]|uniref:Plant calmodulin-binding protein-related n=1 Tax=Striga hermonthica TaxID=68872 RepID=A0A9N7N7P4_STRHE|nr:Plant calmodulin-binding protein-related [Striga hermonthica]